MRLKLDNFEAKALLDTGSRADPQNPAIKVRLGNLEYITENARDGSPTAASYPDVFEFDIDISSYEDGELQLDVEVINVSRNGDTYTTIGVGKLGLKQAVPNVDDVAYFIVDIVGRGNRRAGEVLVRGLIYDNDVTREQLRKTLFELEQLKTSYENYIRTTRDNERRLEDELFTADRDIQQLVFDNKVSEERYAELQQKFVNVGAELLMLKENGSSQKGLSAAAEKDMATLQLINDELTAKLKLLNTENESVTQKLRNTEEDIVVLQGDLEELYASKYEAELSYQDQIAELQAELEQLRANSGGIDAQLVLEMKERMISMSEELTRLRSRAVSSKIVVNSTFISNTSISNTTVTNNFYESIINSTNETNVFITNIVQSGNFEKLRDEFIRQLQQYEQMKTANALLLGRVMALKNNIQVSCRTRPPSEVELQDGGQLCIDVPDDKQGGATEELALYNVHTGQWESYGFDRVWGYDAAQPDVFADVEPLVNFVAAGYNAGVIAYGETGSGKTFTMNGFGTHLGVVYRSLFKLFELLELKKSQAEAKAAELVRRLELQDSSPSEEDVITASAGADTYTYAVEISMMEVWNEGVYDMLQHIPPLSELEGATIAPASTVANSKSLQVTTDPDTGDAVVVGLSMRSIAGLEDAMMTFAHASAHRASPNIARNKESTTILVVKVTSETGSEAPVTRTLKLVDCMGSELLLNAKDHNATTLQGLVALGNVLTALEANAEVVPYHESVVTTLLKNCLGGNAKAIIAVTLSPTDLTLDATIANLQFAKRARNIKINAPLSKGGADSKALEESLLSAKHDVRLSNAKRLHIELVLKESQMSAQELIAHLRLQIDSLQIKLTAESTAKTQVQSDDGLTRRQLIRCWEQLREQLDVNQRLAAMLQLYEDELERLGSEVGTVFSEYKSQPTIRSIEA